MSGKNTHIYFFYFWYQNNEFERKKLEKRKKFKTTTKSCSQLPYHLIHTSYSILYPPFKNSTTRIAIVLTAHSSADCPHSLNIPWVGYSGGFKTLLPIFVGSGRLEILRQFREINRMPLVFDLLISEILFKTILWLFGIFEDSKIIL